MATSAIVSADLPLVPGWDDEAWDDLLNFIEERRVIPILGPELLRVATDDGPRPLYEWLAEKLAARLGVEGGARDGPRSLSRTACGGIELRRR